MKRFYVAVYRPAYPARIGLAVQVYRDKDYSRDVLPPTLTALFEVQAVSNKSEALAAVCEHAAGVKVCVRQLIPSSKDE